MTPDQLDMTYGFRPGTVRDWLRNRVIPAGLDPARLEHAAIAAYLARPAHATDRRTLAERADDAADNRAAQAAEVRRSLALAAEVPCPTTADPAPAAAA